MYFSLYLLNEIQMGDTGLEPLQKLRDFRPITDCVTPNATPSSEDEKVDSDEEHMLKDMNKIWGKWKTMPQVLRDNILRLVDSID